MSTVPMSPDPSSHLGLEDDETRRLAEILDRGLDPPL